MIPPPLNMQSGMPQVGRAFAGWAKPITLDKIVQEVVNGFVIETPMPFTFTGVIQPLSPKSLYLKPEGQRAFSWLQIHCLSGAQNLNINDRIVWAGRIYKVMAQNDYSLDGYIEYHAIRDYQDGAT